MDPDELLKTRGPKALDKVIEDSKPLVEYKLLVLKNKYNLNEFDGKAKYVDEAIDVLLGLEDVEAEVYIDLISNITGVYKDFLRNKLKDRNLKLSEGNVVKSSAIQREEKKDDTIEKAEICVISNILNKSVGTHDPIKLLSLFSGNMLTVATQALNSKTHSEFIDGLLDDYSETIGAVVNYNFSDDEEINSQVFEDCLYLLYKNQLLKKQDELSKKLLVVSADEKNAIMNELKDIIMKINSRRVDLWV
mgnify:FL=1